MHVLFSSTVMYEKIIIISPTSYFSATGDRLPSEDILQPFMTSFLRFWYLPGRRHHRGRHRKPPSCGQSVPEGLHGEGGPRPGLPHQEPQEEHVPGVPFPKPTGWAVYGGCHGRRREWWVLGDFVCTQGTGNSSCFHPGEVDLYLENGYTDKSCKSEFELYSIR